LVFTFAGGSIAKERTMTGQLWAPVATPLIAPKVDDRNQAGELSHTATGRPACVRGLTGSDVASYDARIVQRITIDPMLRPTWGRADDETIR